MSQPPIDLDVIQRWMQAVIMHPGGPAEGIASPEAGRHLDVKAAEVEGVVRGSPALSSIERLEVYAQAYYARLLECLHSEFPVLAQALGDELFDEFAVGYLREYPSASYTLSHLGARFAQYLEETRPVASQAASGQLSVASEEDVGLSWPEFLVDLARLEWTFNEVFDGPGVEGEPLWRAEDLLAVGPEQWPLARLVPVPCLRLLSLRFPVNAYYAATRRGEKPPMPDAAESFVAITRRDYVVRRHDITRLQYDLLSALLAGQSVGDALARVAQSSDQPLDGLAANLRSWFAHWGREGFFRAVDLS